MISLSLLSVGKKYSGTWIFRNLNAQFIPGDIVAVVGSNGSGKSTLLQVISGFVIPDEGSVKIATPELVVDPMLQFRHVAMAAPYLDFPDEFSCRELISFYCSNKKIHSPELFEAELAKCNLKDSENKLLKKFSSGMKQRVRLLLTMFSSAEILLLDEPLTNLDPAGIEWFQHLFRNLIGKKIVLIASNHVVTETDLCNKEISLGVPTN